MKSEISRCAWNMYAWVAPTHTRTDATQQQLVICAGILLFFMEHATADAWTAGTKRETRMNVDAFVWKTKDESKSHRPHISEKKNISSVSLPQVMITPLIRHLHSIRICSSLYRPRLICRTRSAVWSASRTHSTSTGGSSSVTRATSVA